MKTYAHQYGCQDLKLKGGAQKRARAAITHDFKVYEADSTPIKAALGFKMSSMAAMVEAMTPPNKQAFCNYALKQKNMPRIIEFTLNAIKEYNDIEVSY